MDVESSWECFEVDAEEVESWAVKQEVFSVVPGLFSVCGGGQ